jgi:hypothetical protein
MRWAVMSIERLSSSRLARRVPETYPSFLQAVSGPQNRIHLIVS